MNKSFAIINNGRRCIAGALLGCLFLLSGCDDNSAADKIGDIGKPDEAEIGVVATVNGHPVYLFQIEALTDMHNPGLGFAQPATAEELWHEYASSLYVLVTQELIRQELELRGLKVSDSAVLEMERWVSSSYGLEPGSDFDFIIEEVGIQPQLWREQLRAKLEQELLRAELIKSRPFAVEEIELYLNQHPELKIMSSRYDFTLVEGTDKDQAEELREQGETSPEILQEAGMTARRLILGMDRIPAVWQESFSSLQPGEVSAQVERNNSDWGYVVLHDVVPERQRSAIELFSLAEKGLADEILPDLYQNWLNATVQKSQIKVISQFLPQNIPASMPQYDFVLPWDDLSDYENGLGEVEGEVLEGDDL